MISHQESKHDSEYYDEEEDEYEEYDGEGFGSSSIPIEDSQNEDEQDESMFQIAIEGGSTPKGPHIKVASNIRERRQQ